VPFVDVQAHLGSIRNEIWPEIRRVMESGQYIMGPDVTGFEEAFAAYVGVRYAVGVANGTDALALILRALHVGPGDEVIVPALTFVATAEAVVHADARPVLADIDPRTYTIAVDEVAARLSPRTRAVIAVHLYGQPAEMTSLLDLSRSRGIAVVEDAAQAHGAADGERMVGGIGSAAAFSFYPAKNLGALGDAGCVTTNDGTLAAAVRRLRDHGATEKYQHEIVGFNSRLDSIQAAVLRVKLRHLDDWNEARRRHAAAYGARLQSIPGIVLPQPRPGTRHVYHLYVIRLEQAERDALRAYLARLGVETGIHYPDPVHLAPAFRQLGYRVGDFPNAERCARSVLSLPMYPELTLDQIDVVTDGIRGFLADSSGEKGTRR